VSPSSLTPPSPGVEVLSASHFAGEQVKKAKPQSGRDLAKVSLLQVGGALGACTYLLARPLSSEQGPLGVSPLPVLGLPVHLPVSFHLLSFLPCLFLSLFLS
jgi:hypothetical protein